MTHIFDTYHPAVAFAYLACAIALTMAAMHPVYVALSFVGAWVCVAVTRGFRPAVRALAWAVPAALIVAAFNMLFSSKGSTILCHMGSKALYAESLGFGLCAGGMIAAVLLWFSAYTACIDSARFTALFGNVAPVTALMLSQILRLVPQFIARGRVLAAVHDATTVASAGRPGRLSRVRVRARIVSVLMGWGMEDGIVRSDAMRSRGYGCGVHRTSYKRFRFGVHDAAVIACVGVACAASAACAWWACSAFSFYPVMEGLAPWWAYAPYAVFLAIPGVLWVKEQLRWRLSK